MAGAAVPAQPLAGGELLVFSHTIGFRHESIPAGMAALSRIARSRNLDVVASGDPNVFSEANLGRFRAIVLLNATTDPKRAESEWLVGERQTALQRFVDRGGGIMAIHAAADSHYHWPWYGRLIGGRFDRHPPGTPKGRVTLASSSHTANRRLPSEIERVDESYYFDDLDPGSTFLATLDPASIGEKDINPNPVAWTREVDGGRLFYTAMGHTSESYSEPFFLSHLENRLDWILASR